MRPKPKNESSRNLLPYFMECKAWKEHELLVVNNRSYWVVEEPIRASRMYTASLDNKKGYTVQEYLYDMIECIYKSPFSKKTKQRLYLEVDELEQWHEGAGTIEEKM